MGFFGKIFSALKKTKEKISSGLSSLFNRSKFDDEFFDELEEVLISSDISVRTSMDIVDKLRDRVKKEKITDAEAAQQALRDILTETIEEAEPLDVKTPAVIMVIGVNGVGKTTSIGKLAHFLSAKGKSVTIAAADTFRAAASDQLSVWADRANVKIVKSSEGSDPSSVVFDAITSAKAKKTDYLIIDTAGRLHVKANLMEELKKMSRVVERDYPEANFYKFIVLDATTGQNSVNQVEVFNEAVGIDGIILTKLDGTAKGGFVISMCGELGIPVVYVGTGEKLDDIDVFDVEEFVHGIL